MMRPIAEDVMHADVPGIQDTVTHQRHFLPVRKRADDLDRLRFFGLTIRKTPSKDFGKSLSALRWISIQR